MGEARAVMRTLKEERDEIRSHLDGMQVRVRVRVREASYHVVHTCINKYFPVLLLAPWAVLGKYCIVL